MKVLIYVSCFINLGFVLCSPITQSGIATTLRRYARSVGTKENQGNIDCIHMESFPGSYWYSSAGSQEVCGLFVIGLHDQLVEIEFEDFNIQCDKGGLLAVVDGWEVQGQFFPGEMDHQLPMESRYHEYCGKKQPRKIFVSSQNVALIQFRIPTEGEGFRVSIKFQNNPQPCNVVSMIQEGTMTLKNYGKKSNCSISIIFPEEINILSLDVGVTAERASQTMETGTLEKCAKRNRYDRVELRDGDGLDPTAMRKHTDVCGLDSSPKRRVYKLGCQHSVVRLISSGNYYNSVTFKFRQLTASQLFLFRGVTC